MMDFLIVFAASTMAYDEMRKAAAELQLISPTRSQRSDMDSYNEYLTKLILLRETKAIRMGMLTGIALSFRIDPSKFLGALRFAKDGYA